MKCEACNGTGKSAKKDQSCFMCNGTGSMCDICGEAVNDAGMDLCSACMEREIEKENKK